MPDKPMKFLWAWIGTGGAAGAVVRFSISQIIPATTAPVSTAAINISGSLFLAWLVCKPRSIDPRWKAFWTTGFCGSFTTVSLFAYETVLLSSSRPFLALLNAILPPAVAFALAFRFFTPQRPADP